MAIYTSFAELAATRYRSESVGAFVQKSVNWPLTQVLPLVDNAVDDVVENGEADDKIAVDGLVDGWVEDATEDDDNHVDGLDDGIFDERELEIATEDEDNAVETAAVDEKIVAEEDATDDNEIPVDGPHDGRVAEWEIEAATEDDEETPVAAAVDADNWTGEEAVSDEEVTDTAPVGLQGQLQLPTDEDRGVAGIVEDSETLEDFAVDVATAVDTELVLLDFVEEEDEVMDVVEVFVVAIVVVCCTAQFTRTKSSWNQYRSCANTC